MAMILWCQSVIQRYITIYYWPDDPANAEATRKTKRHIKSE